MLSYGEKQTKVERVKWYLSNGPLFLMQKFNIFNGSIVYCDPCVIRNTQNNCQQMYISLTSVLSEDPIFDMKNLKKEVDHIFMKYHHINKKYAMTDEHIFYSGCCFMDF